MMERGLDHLVYATPDLDASVEAFRSLQRLSPEYGPVLRRPTGRSTCPDPGAEEGLKWPNSGLEGVRRAPRW